MADQSAVLQQPATAAPAQSMHPEDHSFFFTALLNAAFRAEELGVTPEQFLEICQAAAAPHYKLVDSKEVIIEPSQQLQALGVTPEQLLSMCEMIVGVMRQLLTENLG
ncbi:MAG: hypothetical protein ACLPTQ_21940 [Terriglobales bacterium]|jgi:hypothetical protein